MGRIIKEDLNLKAYKKIKVPALTVNHIKQRKDFSIWIRNNFTHDSCQKILFFDEKWFNEDGQFNRQNDRVYAESRQAANEDIGTHAVHKYPFKVMVWYGLTYNGPTSIVVLPEKTSFDSDFYINSVLPKVSEEGIKLVMILFINKMEQRHIQVLKPKLALKIWVLSL